MKGSSLQSPFSCCATDRLPVVWPSLFAINSDAVNCSAQLLYAVQVVVWMAVKTYFLCALVIGLDA
ncbi:hypothetical protein M8C21_030930 [Ambrosia artemisiifolia]|uniref:Uncharacterized protein n=1 Tax=Ambrosia artemisiifolia TaxID=4212 RepID=A0AAD5D5J1_AMBAR|nr:hypothetical protein M8C21_030930 [Ambrosia artemisiifolia]